MRHLTTTRALLAGAVLAGPAALAATAAAEEVVYDVGGVAHAGYWAAAAEPRGTVLIVHDWDGMTEYETRRADMLAELGWNAFALDMFGADSPAETTDHRRAATGELYADRGKMRALLDAGLAQARARAGEGPLVVIGYCFGGAVALEMARSDMAGEAAGFASFHGGLTTPEGQGWDGDEPPVRVYHGGADTSITLDDAATLAGELEAAGATYTLEIYSGAPHAFTVFGSERYQERADRESWEDFTGFLATVAAGS